MSAWETSTIGEIGQVFDGPHATPKTIDAGPVFLGIPSLKAGRLDLSKTRHVSEKDFDKWTRRVEPAAGDIVFSYETKIGEAAMIPEGLRCCLGRRMGLVRLDPMKCDPRYFLYQYLCPEYQRFLASVTVHGATVDRLLLKDFPKYEFPLPPIEEQREIAAVLGALDNKIELNRKTAATLEEMARALYRSWFVDFDPVHTKAAGRAPAHMDAATAALFPDSFGEDGLPVGWKAGTLADFAFLNSRKHSKKKHPAQIEYVDLANTKWGTIEATAEYKWDDAPSRARMSLAAGDTIVGTVRPGNGSFSYVSKDGLTGSTGFAVLSPKDGRDASLVFLAATDPATIEILANLADGGAYPAVRPEVVAAREITMAPEDLLLAFSKEASPLIAKIEAGKEENKTLAALRDALLPRLMSGELRVGEAKEQVEAAT